MCLGSKPDGWMLDLALLSQKNRSEREKSLPLPTPVLKMTVNFHPLLQNGCLMINGGSALRSGSHAAPAHSGRPASAKRPAALWRGAPAREETLS